MHAAVPPTLSSPVAKQSKHADPEIVNRKARHDYHIDETLEVGVILQGSEVKSIRDGKVSLNEGYVRVEEAPPGLFLHNVQIEEYPPAAGTNQHAPKRVRTLLAHKREVAKLARATAQKGFTVVPLKMYFKTGRAKILIGVARGKAAFDKRQDLKTREARRDIDRAMTKRA